jgi:hypothetical protein
MRLTDPRLLSALVIGLLFTGVAAYAVLSASLDDSVFQAPTIKADQYFIGSSTTLAAYINSVVTGSATGYGPYTYTFVQDGLGNFLAISATGTVDFNTTSAYTTIQNAIDSVTTTWAAQAPVSFKVGPGTWTLTTGLQLPNNCNFDGAGAESTWLVKSGAGTYVVGPKYANYTYNVRIRDIRIDANSVATYAIQWSNTAVTLPGGQTYFGWLNLENVHVRGASTTIYIKSTSGINMICWWSNVRAASSKIYIERASDSIFTNVYCGSAEVVASASCLFNGWYVGGAANPNFLLHGGSAAYPTEKNSFVNMHFDNPSGDDLTVGDYAYYNTFTGCKFTNHNGGGTTNTYSAVNMIETAKYNTFTGCTFSQDATPPGNDFKYWYEESNSADYNNIVGCIFGSTGIGTAALSHAANTEHTGNIGD